MLLSFGPGLFDGVETAVVLVVVEGLIQCRRHMMGIGEVVPPESPVEAPRGLLDDRVDGVVQVDQQLFLLAPSFLYRLITSCSLFFFFISPCPSW